MQGAYGVYVCALRALVALVSSLLLEWAFRWSWVLLSSRLLSVPTTANLLVQWGGSECLGEKAPFETSVYLTAIVNINQVLGITGKATVQPASTVSKHYCPVWMQIWRNRYQFDNCGNHQTSPNVKNLLYNHYYTMFDVRGHFWLWK